MGLEFLKLIINPVSHTEIQKSNKLNSPTETNERLTPKTIDKMKRIKSEEDFMKMQVPWIL
jgi:hypothetical protein